MSATQAPFAERLQEAMRRTRTPTVVGVDPDWSLLPPECKRNVESGVQSVAEAVEDFCTDILRLAAERVPAVKFQAAFFETLGPAGFGVLQRCLRRARQVGLLTILDAKRGDIGNTATAYATACLTAESPFAADALTVNPYLGDEGLAPFVEAAQKNGTGLFVLVRTSNPGAGRLQDADAGGRPVYELVADMVNEAAARTRCTAPYSPVGAVVGATAPAQLVRLRGLLPHSIFLIPGYGAQGGSAQDCRPAFDADGFGAVVNNSRGILYAYRKPEYAGQDWRTASQAALEAMIADLRRAIPQL